MHPCLSEAIAAGIVIFTHQTCYREDERQLVVVGQGIDIRIHVIVRLPSRLFTMVAVVDDTYTTINMVADGGR